MGWVINATPRQLYPWERSGTHCMGDCTGPRADLDGCGNSRHPLGFDPRTVQPVTSRYTDYAVPAHACSYDEIKLSQLAFYLSCVTIEALT
jgi:hypothetical protein